MPYNNERLLSYVTNLNSDVFCLQNLPEVVKGALFSRYSRSSKTLRQILLDEFLPDDVSPIETTNLVDITKAQEFYDRVLVGYGDDSVAELGGAHIACENISSLAALALEDSRIGISFLEKSTRYVRFDQKTNGEYFYYQDTTLTSHSKFQFLYRETMDKLFDTYSKLFELLSNWLFKNILYDEDLKFVSELAFRKAVKAKTCDLLRGLLPLATLTNVGMYGNGRAFEYLLIKLATSPWYEVNGIGVRMQRELDKVIPSFVKRSKYSGLGGVSWRMARKFDETKYLTKQHLDPLFYSTKTVSVELLDFDAWGAERVIAAILYPHSSLPFEIILNYVDELCESEREEIINTYVGDRFTRHERPGRAFEESYYTFEIVADIGAYRDLHRHRLLTQERQNFSPSHGYSIPAEVEAAGLAQPYQNALDQAADTFGFIERDLFYEAQYVVPFAYRVRWRMKLNLREAYHLIELRSSRQGHASYRAIAQQMYQQIKEKHPLLVAPMRFVDFSDYSLERLAAEQKAEGKS